jgi:hypothetical protein
VRDVIVAEGTGPDDGPYLHVLVKAADPDPNRGTWSRDGVFALRSLVGELAARSAADLPSIIVDVYPESETVDDDDDVETSAALAQDLGDDAL